jgi:hypothetical protein
MGRLLARPTHSNFDERQHPAADDHVLCDCRGVIFEYSLTVRLCVPGDLGQTHPAGTVALVDRVVARETC